MVFRRGPNRSRFVLVPNFEIPFTFSNMSISISVLSSGSRGNSTFIRAGRVRLLIDCGLGRRALQKRLHAIGENRERPPDVVGISNVGPGQI